MRRLDWYILKKFFVTFFFCLLVITAIAIAVDSSEKAGGLVKSGVSKSDVIWVYYPAFIPYIWGLMFPIFVFVAVIFFTSRMAMQSEIIAILASGVSYRRLLRPYLIGGLILAGLLWIGNRSYIPHANAVKNSFYENEFIGSDNYSGCFNCYYRRTDTNSFVALKDFNLDTKIAYGFAMQKLKNGKVTYNIRSNMVRWDTIRHQWQLINARERIINNMGETIRHYDSLLLDLNLKPEELKRDNNLKDKLTSSQLKSFIDKEEMRGTEGLNIMKVEYYRRTATSYAVLLLTMIGAVIASRKTRGGGGLHIAIGIVIAAFFVLSDRFSTVFSTNGNFSPFIAAWLPNFVFTLIALIFYRFTPK